MGHVLPVAAGDQAAREGDKLVFGRETNLFSD
jgi:hypothetical protein